jgi:hypothetical protein
MPMHACMQVCGTCMCVCVQGLLLILERSSPPRRPTSNFACTAHMCLLPPHAHVYIYIYIYIYICIYIYMMHLRLLQQQCKHELHWCMHAFYMHICAARLLLTLERSNPARRPHKHLERSTFACTAHLCLLPPHNLSISLSLSLYTYLSIYKHTHSHICFCCPHL